MKWPIHVLLMALLCQSCTGADRVATFKDPDSGLSISLELTANHPYLAEYKRQLVVLTAKGGNNRMELFPDTGGYAAANLYFCSEGRFLVVGYSDQTKIDPISGSLESSNCSGTRKYLGVFDGAGSKPWEFYPATERAERKLEMQGG